MRRKEVDEEEFFRQCTFGTIFGRIGPNENDRGLRKMKMKSILYILRNIPVLPLTKNGFYMEFVIQIPQLKLLDLVVGPIFGPNLAILPTNP